MALFVILLCALLGYLVSKQIAVRTLTNEGFEIVEDSSYPLLDWDYWQAVNPDVVGWITIPGSNVDYPIVQAPASEPQYYLTHDVYGSWSYYGCPYLDVSCSEQGFDSPNAVIYGHNIGYDDKLMFADVAKYSDKDWATDHDAILIQTPSRKYQLLVKCAEVVPGEEDSQQTDFTDPSHYQNWFAARFSNCNIQLVDQIDITATTVTLVTCSYTTYPDERTLVYAQVS